MTEFPLGSKRAERQQLLRKGDRMLKLGRRQEAFDAFNDAALLDMECIREEAKERGERGAGRRKPTVTETADNT